MIDVIFNFLLYLDLLITDNITVSITIFFIFAFLFFAFSIPGNLIIILSSSFFFGFIVGFLINIITIVLGSLCFFLFFKNIFKKYFNKQIEKFSDKLNKIIKKSSFEYLVLLRLIFGVPLFVQNLFLSTLNISKTKFIISSFIGFTPYFLLFSFIGNQFSDLIEVKEFQLSNILSFELILIFLLLIIFLLLRIFFKFK